MPVRLDPHFCQFRSAATYEKCRKVIWWWHNSKSGLHSLNFLFADHTSAARLWPHRNNLAAITVGHCKVYYSDKQITWCPDSNFSERLHEMSKRYIVHWSKRNIENYECTGYWSHKRFCFWLVYITILCLYFTYLSYSILRGDLAYSPYSPQIRITGVHHYELWCHLKCKTRTWNANSMTSSMIYLFLAQTTNHRPPITD